MKMRSLIFGIAVFVCSALIFSGCEQEANDDGGDTIIDLTALNPYPKTKSSDIKGYSNSLTIDSVILNNSTGVVTITLRGTIVDVRATEGYTATDTSSDTFWQASYPYDGQFTPEAGKYGAFVFNGAFPDDAGSKSLAIKSTNNALRYYSGSSSPYKADGPLAKPATSVQKNIHIPESGVANNWRLRDVGGIPDSDWLSVLLWSEANPKRIDLEIQEFASFNADSTYTVLHRIVIDYSKVEFQTPAEALAEELGTGATASGTTVTLADNVTIDATKTVTVPAGVTLSVASDATLSLSGTLDVGSGTLTFEDDDSSLILLAGASLKAGASGKFVANSSANAPSSVGITLTVGTAAAPETATGFTSATANSVITLTTATTAGTATATDYIIGDAKFGITSTSAATAANAVTSTALGSDTADAGTIKAGEGTAITFAGKSST